MDMVDKNSSSASLTFAKFVKTETKLNFSNGCLIANLAQRFSDADTHFLLFTVHSIRRSTYLIVFHCIIIIIITETNIDRTLQ